MGQNEISMAFEIVKKEITGLKAISAVDVEAGLVHGSLIVDKAFDLDAASAYNSEVLKAKIKAKDAMGMEKEKIEIAIFELSTQIHIIQPTENNKYLIYMAADKATTNIGIARKSILKAGVRIQEILK